MRAFAIACSFLPALASAADEKEDPRPVLTAMVPLSLEPGATVTLQLRGQNLKDAMALEWSVPAGQITSEIKEKKDAGEVKGLDKKAAGETQVEAAVTLTADVPPGSATLVIVTPNGKTAPREFHIVPAGTFTEEKEPNDGFRGAQEISEGRTVKGGLKEAKDVDVYRFQGAAAQRISVSVRAAGAGSLLDPLLTLFDQAGNPIASSDDASSTDRDSNLTVTLPNAGPVFMALVDANDVGGGWHTYELTIREATP